MKADEKTLVHQDSNVSSLEVPEAYKPVLGTYRLDKSDKFEEFMSKLGVSPFWLLSDGVTRPVTVISYVVQLGQFRMETRTALKKTELVFKLNEDFIEITADGRRATSRVTTSNHITVLTMCCVQISLKGNTMVHTQTGEKTATREDLTTEVTRTFDTEVGHSAVL